MLLVSQIEDIASGSYMPPTYFRDMTDFVRAFISQEKDKEQSPFMQFPDDYKLHFKYRYDESIGSFILNDVPIALTFNDLLDCIYLIDANGNRLETIRPTASIVELIYSAYSYDTRQDLLSNDCSV